ncbi:hypothetical protein HMPREF0322_02232 [Desulfitobacterium hafniense DP7]|uniref:Uncharacterized protein n=1 Tax=Desulfitobacterium hafniense DP7 TaxID=537010 RepID=G9XMP4_DESHA|nr:hypothetical protein HMPREF0322_02232 [Desulfitobacterium hafniense DP7]
MDTLFVCCEGTQMKLKFCLKQVSFYKYKQATGKEIKESKEIKTV